jgi:FdhD protein
MLKDGSMEWVEYTKVGSGLTREKEKIVTELGLSIYVNGEHFTTSMITPMMEKEFVVGNLFTRGLIESAADIESLTIKSDTAEVTLPEKEHAERSLEIHSDFQVSKDDVFEGMNVILSSEIYAETGGIHSAGLFKRKAELVCVTEDIGRHNALDKVIGYALINGMDLRNTFAASTGRMVSEMVLKVCRANIPVVATKAAVTKLGIEIGEKYGLTIVGYVRDKGMKISSDTDERIATERLMKIYTHPERIL